MEIIVITSLNDLYLYDDIRRLLLCDDSITCIDKDNAPMNKRAIKVHKGVDNSLKFRVFSPDRTPVNVCGYDLYARLYNNESGELVLEKRCTTNTAKGMVFLELNEGDIANFAPGSYDMVMLAQEDLVHNRIGDAVSKPLYTDLDSNIVATVEITNQAERAPRPSYEIGPDDWSQSRILLNGAGPLVLRHYSSSIPANRVQNHINATHSFSVYATEEHKYTGTLTILGTLDLNPQEDPDTAHWFKIMALPDAEEIKFENFYGTEAFTFSANVMYLKFMYTPSHEVNEPGMIHKILIRS